MIKILNIENGNTDHEALLSKVIIVLDALLASPVFEKEFLKLQIDYSVDNRQLLDAIQSTPIAFNVRFFERDSPVLGMASEERERISLNTRYFQEEKVANIASTIYHEWLHILGYDHDSSKDYDSVPYAAGHLVKRLIRKYPYKGGKLKTVNRGFPLCFLKTTKWV